MSQQHPLANDERGIAFELPENARRWRVQRMTGRRGKQEVIYDNGAPLEIGVSATASDLRSAVERVSGYGWGRYRLEAVDERGVSVGAVAYTVLADGRGGVPGEETHDEEHGELAGGEMSRALRVLKETIEEVRKRDADTTQALRSRDEQSLDQLRRSNQELTQALAGTVQALTRGYAPVVPLPEYEQAPEPPAPLDEKTIVQQVTELLQAAPQAIPVIAQLLQALRQQAASVSSPPDGKKPDDDDDDGEKK